VAGGGACAGAGPRRAEAREGLWTRSRRPRLGRAGDAWRGVAAAAGPWGLAGDLATGGGRRGRGMAAAAHHRYAGRDGGVASGIAANSARAGRLRARSSTSSGSAQWWWPGETTGTL